MLQVEDLEVRYGKVAAISGISLEVPAGQVVGLIGPNGAGKTSTLTAIFGLVPSIAGKLAFEGRSLVGRTPEEIVRAGLALVPEGRHIFSTLTVDENLRLGAVTRTDRDAVAREIRELYERFPVLGRLQGQLAGQLSGGEQQQLAIARALLSRPRLLLLDEPSLGLAPLVIDLVFEVLTELRDRGVTILLVEQNAARAVAFADHTYVLRAGRVAAAGPRAELLGKVNLADIYLGV